MKDKDKQILVSSLLLFYDTNKHCLVATPIENYPGIPFMVSPSPSSISERYAFRMYATNNLYHIISNGGVELNKRQKEVISKIRRKVIGNSSMSRIENESTATLSREEIHSLITEIDEHISKRQIRDMAEKQEIHVEI